MSYFLNKMAIVTGGASGIGLAVCRELIRRGANVVIADINEAGAVRAAKEIVGNDRKVEATYLDVTDFSAVKALAENVKTRHGRLDFMFNNAGVAVFGETRDFMDEDWQFQFSVNLDGVVNGIKATYPIMIEQKSGHIVNTASIAGLVPTPTLLPYTATKHAVVGLSGALRAEGKDFGVRVSVVCPGFVRTNMFNCTLRKVEFKDLEKGIPEQMIWLPEKAAKAILDGVARNKQHIVFPFYARLAWWLHRLHPNFSKISQQKMVKNWRKIRKA